MLLSLSLSRSDDDACHTHFRELEVSTVRGVAAAITGRYHWSPIIWGGGIRKSTHFVSAQLAVLDFDDGLWTVQDAATWAAAEALAFVLGTTRSHGKPKGSRPPCDRFRLVLRFDIPITDLETYRHNMRALVARCPADKACTDGARKYRPCREIVAWGAGGSLPIARYTPPTVDYEAARRRLAMIRTTGAMPPWVYDGLAGIGVQEGDRNGTCYRLARRMVSYGVPPSEIERLIVNSQIPLPQQEKLNAARSGIRAGQQDR